jgi:hypothetical protein
MKIYYDDSHTCSGKTERVIRDIVENRCKTLFITERIKSFKELELRMNLLAGVYGTAPIIDKVNCAQTDRLGSVSRQIEALPDRHRSNDHVIVLATHAGMLRSDFSDFAGWRIIVDEVPAFLDFEEKRTHLDAAFFQAHYQLEAAADGWSFVKATHKGSALSVTDVLADQSHDHLAVFHRRVLEATPESSNRCVLVNLPSWDKMSDQKVQWCWASAFSLNELEPFDSVTLLGNRFRADVGSLISEHLCRNNIEWEALPPPPQSRHFQFRPVHINYFSESRAASRHLFESEEGQAMLREIGMRLAQELPGSDHIWTANGRERGASKVQHPKALLESAGMNISRYLTPRQSGTNIHSKVSHAAAIYSAKASPNLVALLDVLGIERRAWERSIEHEAILQFVTRTSVRDPDNCSPVRLWVFDRDQALYLKTYFDGLGFASATMSLVPDGPAIPAKQKCGRQAKVYSPNEIEERKAIKTAKDRERKRRSRARKKQEREAAAGEINKAA